MDVTALIHIGRVGEGKQTKGTESSTTACYCQSRVCGREKASMNARCYEREKESARVWCDSGGVGKKRKRVVDPSKQTSTVNKRYKW